MENIEVILVKRGYVVTEEGEMLNPSGKVIGKSINQRGYYQSTIRVKGENVKIYPHRLQAFQKYGNQLFEKGIMVRHSNNIRTDNSWSNILIGDNSQNQMDIPKQIRVRRAMVATSKVRKYNKTDVRNFYKKCSSYKKTMEEFDITSKGTLHYILNS